MLEHSVTPDIVAGHCGANIYIHTNVSQHSTIDELITPRLGLSEDGTEQCRGVPRINPTAVQGSAHIQNNRNPQPHCIMAN